MIGQCQSCEREPAVVTESRDNVEAPYLLCRGCQGRLLSRSLRPSEWFNLSSHFGWWQFLLHDDFYDEDGSASQPEQDVIDAASHPSPMLAEVSRDPSRLLGYTMTRWSIDERLSAAWCQLPHASVLDAIQETFVQAPNSGVRSTCLDVAAIALKSSGSSFVKNVWLSHQKGVELTSLFRASAACLPLEEGFRLACAALDALSTREQRDAKVALSYFQSPLALRWIETHAAEPTTEDWGHLAAASCMSWRDVVSWLEFGRPLSLIAIDALRAIAEPRTPLLRAMSPALLAPPRQAELISVLTAYETADPVPRVRQRIATLRQLQHRLCTEG